MTAPRPDETGTTPSRQRRERDTLAVVLLASGALLVLCGAATTDLRLAVAVLGGLFFAAGVLLGLDQSPGR